MMYLDMMYTPPGTFLRVMSTVLFLGQIYVCRQAAHQKRKPRVILLAVMNALLGTILFGILIGDRDRIVSGASLAFQELAMQLYRLPWAVFLILEALETFVLILFIRSILRFSRNTMTPDAIKETVDLLPAGLCFGNDRGEVMLANIRMTELCFALTGKLLQNVGTLWKTVTARGEEQDGKWLVRTENGDSWLFSRSDLMMNGQPYTQISASDVTEQARITEDLKAKNAKLREVQYRMKAYHAREAEMFMDEELLAARTEVHDGLGHLLLMGRYDLEHPGKTDEAELLQMMKRACGSMIAQAEEPQKPRDPFTEAMKRAGLIGVRVETDGSVPDSGKARDLIGYALRECAANTVKHAGGETVRMTVRPAEHGLRAVFTNDGEPPQEPIRELGGLHSLRRMVEEAGGSMTLKSAPCFRMTLLIPEE